MRLHVTEDYGIKLTEVFAGILLETAEGHQLGICMRDATFEINVVTSEGDHWHRVNPQTGAIAAMRGESRADSSMDSHTGGGP